MEFIKDSRNDLLNRREVVYSMETTANPGFESTKKHLADKLKKTEDSIVITKIKNNYGSKEFLIEALIYDALTDKERIEQKPKVKKKAEGAA
jgi:ribosomal protein S24E